MKRYILDKETALIEMLNIISRKKIKISLREINLIYSSEELLLNFYLKYNIILKINKGAINEITK